MEIIRRESSQKSFKFIVIRGAVCALILVIYLAILRPTRIAVNEEIIYPQIANIHKNEANFNFGFQSGALVIEHTFYDQVKKLSYRPGFGFFFLITLMSFIFITNRLIHYGILFGFHLITSVIAYLCLITAAAGWPLFFIFVDGINGYLTPALSLSLVPLIMSRKI